MSQADWDSMLLGAFRRCWVKNTRIDTMHDLIARYQLLSPDYESLVRRPIKWYQRKMTVSRFVCSCLHPAIRDAMIDGVPRDQVLALMAKNTASVKYRDHTSGVEKKERKRAQAEQEAECLAYQMERERAAQFVKPGGHIGAIMKGGKSL